MLKIKHLALILSLTFSALTMAAAPLENLSLVKARLIEYHDSGQYYQDISTRVKEARDYLQFRLTQNRRAKNPKKLAMVLDIDETSLSNYPSMTELNFGGSLKHIKELEMKAIDPPIPYTRSLYQFARANGVVVFFITGRQDYERAATEANLRRAGFNEWTDLYLKPNEYKQKSIIAYKSAMRQKIQAQGYDIVVNMGDQESDLKGGFADMGFKLPNPYYLIN